MPPSTLSTVNYDSVLSTTLFNYRKTLEDNISKTNAFIWQLMKKDANGYVKIDSIGDRAAIPLMYELGTADSFAGYDVLDTTPMDGITTAFFDWRQCAVPVAISGLEEKKNKGEAKIINLLEAKTKQAEMGIQEFFSAKLIQGAGSTSITSAYTSAANGSTFVDPLPLLVHYAPTGSAVIGNINQSTYSWWQNQQAASSGTTFASILTELRKLRMKCKRGPGGAPNLSLVDENVYALYEAALAASHRNPSYQRADIPFDNVAFYTTPVVADELVPDVANGTTTQTTTSGTWYMLNTQFFQVQVEATTDFVPTPFQKPENQDAKVSHIMWLGAVCVSNRRKQGVLGSIDTTVTS